MNRTGLFVLLLSLTTLVVATFYVTGCALFGSPESAKQTTCAGIKLAAKACEVFAVTRDDGTVFYVDRAELETAGQRTSAKRITDAGAE